MASMDNYVVEMINIHKVYPDGVVALRSVDFRVRKGEIHGLLGENGAGKTTLMRILYGEIKPTMGEIRVKGEKVSFHNPRDAIRRGIGMVYQHFTLIPSFTVLENLYLSLSRVEKGITVKDVINRVENIVRETNLKIPLDAVVEDLPIGIQQRVEIVKNLIRRAEILILDEPTSVLTPLEVRELFNALRKFKEMGLTIIFITHKLKEVMEITDRVTILRKGRVVDTVETKHTTVEDLARMMVGREVLFKHVKKPSKPGVEVLIVNDLHVLDDRGLEAVKGVSFTLREGEILGIAGVQGNGQQELAEALAGVRKPVKGKILLKNKDITFTSTLERYKLGLAYIPASRRIGLVYDMNIVENAILTSVKKYTSRFNLLNWIKAVDYSNRVVSEFQITTPSVYTLVRYLSGGNQQKLMIGRDILREPDVIVFCEPTQGLDVAATDYVWKLILELKDKGKSILLISSDLDEILDLSDRIAVMYEGRFLSIDKTENYTLEKLGLLMGGYIV